MNSKGIALVEVVVGAAIIVTIFTAVFGVYTVLTRLSAQSLPRIQAAMLAEEGIEAARAMRDGGYSSSFGSLSNGSTYYFEWNAASSTYKATTAYSQIDSMFTRTFVLSPAYRDGSYNLASSGTSDTNTKLITVTVAWLQNGATSTYVVSSYITNIFNN